MSTWSRSQWIEDAKKRVLQNTRRTDDYTRELIFLYDEAAVNIEKEIEALFARFARDNGLTEEAARQLLEGREYSVWRKSIEEYIAGASGVASSSKALLELNTLAMKSRITRKEQLLANVYRNMIDLAEDSTARLDALLGDMLKVNYYESCFTIQRGIGLAHPAGVVLPMERKALLRGCVGGLRPSFGSGQAGDHAGLYPGQQCPEDGKGHRRGDGQGPLQCRAPGADRVQILCQSGGTDGL